MQIYIQSGVPLPFTYRDTLTFPKTREAHARQVMWLLRYVKEGQNGWLAQMPPGFKPCSLQQCNCSACPECLAQAGVPVLCEESWTRDDTG